MLYIILAESSLELIPKKIHNHPSVTSYSKKFKKNSSNTLLDNSWHFGAMKGLDNEIKRGRPDIIHLTLLSLCTTPVFYKNKIKIFIHTVNDEVISINNNTRLPKSYHRFQGLMEKLFLTKKIESEDEILMEMKNSSLPQLISKIKPTQIIGLTTQGQKTSLDKLVEQIEENSCIILGGFQKGHFNNETDKIIDKSFSINDSSLEAHLVASRLAYEYEKTIFI
ncbi:MAG: ribosome biogenesis protein [Candidatus Nitrosopelagicus sp.]|mgnify:FL=1|jgi:rRNA small subunit pseudouridine methyltransferase Nep1|nr:ribosome biogenesis protein [Candidatus Nitrosopelagicus sp.]MBT6647075.1 ribosome biogenesis protein [Nitrososphaerota archaeon]MBT3762214.1 ribosome biogenesis protein [Candidatus Nitrosopelagicus sp.]MBT4327724.1 ribosome biogenesis protein [Candidatus Nitrosopelagicus sp.]MBT4454335.1 ribosome biogenesis protein [Candidatus Nitrosopelagicus sp.]|tara:strand:- start:25 stop:693 length:669 start_codon:yes stop_codon:yes gene_type:complete